MADCPIIVYVPAESCEALIAGRYAVLEELGHGGMGAVYRARDQRDGRDIALKRMRPGGSGGRVALELFEREFHTLSELAHPRIIEVYDYGVDAESAYYTMELLGGRDLRELGQVGWRTACELLRDVASSLAIVHSRRLLHGDLSPRNVRCTLDGRAKLLDFGAMVPMGVAKRVSGTPPFIAPEMMQLQALDGRTDLYALGALGYLLLTGRHAFPASKVSQLRDLWRSPPVAPSAIASDVPSALSDLVMELLQLNRNARPRSAGIVMERLCAIASLPFEEQADVALAYLTTPSLVGRDEQLAVVRGDLLRAMQGSGRVTVVQGPSGSGRSRFLDACVLEAKLLGLHVLRADLGDTEGNDYGVAGALCRQLFELAPDLAKRASRVHAPVLAHALGSELVEAQPSTDPPERRVVQLSLRDFVLSVVRSLPLVVAVDDADRIDEGSSSLLLAIGQKVARRSLGLILAIDSEDTGSAALDVLSRTAKRIDLPPLTEAQTEQLLGSVFGEAKHTLTVARGVHAVSHGSPRAIMQLTAHLVEQGIARYEAGSFILPDRLRQEDLPPSLSDALVERAAKLEPDALELARMLALSDPTELPSSNYVELTSHGDRARTYRALDQLVRVQLVLPQGDRYRLGDPTWRSVLCDGLPDEQRVALHARLARVFERSGTVTRRAYHLMESEQPEAATRVLLAQYLRDPNEPSDPLEGYVPGMLDLLERAALAAEALKLPAPLRMEMRMKVIGGSQFLGDLTRFLRVAPPALEQLERDSGLFDYGVLDPSMEPSARLTEALTRAQRRYESTPDSDRGLPVADAIRELARLCAMFSGMNTTAQDPRLLDRVPPLAPFVPLSPAIAVIAQTIEASRAVRQGRDQLARSLLLQVADRIAQPDGGGLGALYASSMRLGALYAVGLMDASAGIPNATERVVDHERTPGYRVNAQRVHMACHLMQGDFAAAAAAQRRAELVMLQDGHAQRYPGTTLRAELYAYWLSDDAAGLKDVIERIARMVQHYPAWRTLLEIARALHRSMQGDHLGAQAALEPALELARPLEHRDWAWVSAVRVQVLVGLGRAQEAAELGLRDMQVCERAELGGHRRVAQAAAEALIAASRTQQAAELADQLLAQAVEQGVRGIALGALYELRARAALACDDAAGYRDFADRCAAEYRIDRNPALAARYDRLCREGQPRAVAPPTSSAAPGAESTHRSSVSTIYSRLLECSDASARVHCVLTILAEQMNAERAYLYGEREGQLTFVHGMPDATPPGELRLRVEAYLARAREPEASTVYEPAIVRGDSKAPPLSVPPDSQTEPNTGAALLVTPEGVRFYPVMLAAERGGERAIAGVAALAVRGSVTLPSDSLLDALAVALLDHDDVDPVTCVV